MQTIKTIEEATFALTLSKRDDIYKVTMRVGNQSESMYFVDFKDANDCFNYSLERCPYLWSNSQSMSNFDN